MSQITLRLFHPATWQPKTLNLWHHTESANSGCNSKNQGQGQQVDKLEIKYKVIITWLYEKANSKFSRTIDFKEGWSLVLILARNFDPPGLASIQKPNLQIFLTLANSTYLSITISFWKLPRIQGLVQWIRYLINRHGKLINPSIFHRMQTWSSNMYVVIAIFLRRSVHT